MKNRSPSSESGNILFLILIAVVLFAALSFAVSQTMRHQNITISSEKNKVSTLYLHEFPAAIRQAVTRMQVGGDTDLADLSFAHHGTTDYGTFGTTPAHEVFHPQGGDLPYQLPLEGINDGTDWIFNGDLEIDGVGQTNSASTGSDLVALLPGVTQAICEETNYGVSGVRQTPPTLNLTGETNKYTGSFGYADTVSDAVLIGRDSYCYYSSALSKYVFYYVLVQR